MGFIDYNDNRENFEFVKPLLPTSLNGTVASQYHVRGLAIANPLPAILQRSHSPLAGSMNDLIYLDLEAGSRRIAVNAMGEAWSGLRWGARDVRAVNARTNDRERN